MARRAFIQRCQTVDDWIELRDIFVRSFKQYPLFEHVVPNEDNRAEFMKRYFTANYEVHANEGKCVLLSIRKLLGINDITRRPSQILLRNDLKAASKIVGGVFYVGPAKDGIGWSQGSDEAYWNAYEQQGLHKFDPEAYERLKRYEAWESEHVLSYLLDLQIPLWNALLCAIDPKHAGSGCGSEIYSTCMQAIGKPEYVGKENIVLKEVQEGEESGKNEKQRRDDSTKLHSGLKNSFMPQSKNSDNKKGPFKNFTIKLLHSLSLLTHHPYHAVSLNTVAATSPSNYGEISGWNYVPVANSPQTKEKNEAISEAGVVALSHCPRATQFHIRNGFRCVKTIPYNPAGDDKPLFNVYVLLNNIPPTQMSQILTRQCRG